MLKNLYYALSLFKSCHSVCVEVGAKLRKSRKLSILRIKKLQVAIIYAVVNNLLKDIEVEDISRFEIELFEYLAAAKDEILAEIRNTGVLSKENEAALREAIIYTKNKFLGITES